MDAVTPAVWLMAALSIAPPQHSLRDTLKVPVAEHMLPRLFATTSTCFHKGERTSGFNKICYYDCLGDTVALNVSAIQLCPLTIRG